MEKVSINDFVTVLYSNKKKSSLKDVKRVLQGINSALEELKYFAMYFK